MSELLLQVMIDQGRVADDELAIREAEATTILRSFEADSVDEMAGSLPGIVVPARSSADFFAEVRDRDNLKTLRNRFATLDTYALSSPLEIVDGLEEALRLAPTFDMARRLSFELAGMLPHFFAGGTIHDWLEPMVQADPVEWDVTRVRTRIEQAVRDGHQLPIERITHTQLLKTAFQLSQAAQTVTRRFLLGVDDTSDIAFAPSIAQPAETALGAAQLTAQSMAWGILPTDAGEAARTQAAVWGARAGSPTPDLADRLARLAERLKFAVLAADKLGAWVPVDTEKTFMASQTTRWFADQVVMAAPALAAREARERERPVTPTATVQGETAKAPQLPPEVAGRGGPSRTLHRSSADASESGPAGGAAPPDGPHPAR